MRRGSGVRLEINLSDLSSSGTLAIIPARGGSKGVPGKNIRVVGGKPLIAWTIEAAKQSACIDRVILSSDDEAIIEQARRYECEVPFVREARLAQDESTSMDVVVDALDRFPDFEWVVLLQPTSPLRSALDIDRAIELCKGQNAPACVSVSASQESPYWMFTLRDNSTLEPILPPQVATRRQDLPSVYSLNGAIYVAKTGWLRQNRSFLSAETVAYVMPNQRSLDIDTESDFIQLQIFLGDFKNVSLS